MKNLAEVQNEYRFGNYGEAEWYEGSLFIMNAGKQVAEVKGFPKPISGHYDENGNKFAELRDGAVSKMDSGERFFTVKKEDDGQINIVFHKNF